MLVSNEEMYDFVKGYGVPEERIRISGYPVRREFEEVRAIPKHVLREKFKIPEGKVVVPIVSGGGRWNPDVAGRLKALATTRDPRAKDRHVVVVTGGDRKLIEQVHKVLDEGVPSGISIHVMEDRLDAREMAEVLRVGDLDSIKGGGGAYGETNAVGTVALLYYALSGIEEKNIDNAKVRGTAIVARSKTDFVEAVLDFKLEDAEKYLREQEKLIINGSAKWIAQLLHSVVRGEPEPAPPVPLSHYVQEPSAEGSVAEERVTEVVGETSPAPVSSAGVLGDDLAAVPPRRSQTWPRSGG